MLQSHSRKNRTNWLFLLDFSSFAAWEHRHRNNCLQDKNHEKTHQLFNRKHGHLRSAASDFYGSSRDAKALYRLLADRWSSWQGLMQAGLLFTKRLHCCIYSQSLVLIAVDRFGAVVYPLRSSLISSKMCPFFILATWIVASAVFSPYLFALKLVENPGGLVCQWHWNKAFGEFSTFENYYASIIGVIYFIPLVLIAILYTIIYIKLKSQKIPGEQSVNAGQQRQQRERNVLKMAIAIVLGYAVCYLPSTISFFLLWFASDIRSCAFNSFFSVARVMARSNCAINPCICFIFSRNYRDGFKTLFMQMSHL